MASAIAAKKMRDEATCSICLQLMKEPVSINCGHSFCRLCVMGILQNRCPTTLLRIFPCPLCRIVFQSDSLRPNRHLEGLIETIKEFDLTDLCEEHGEQLSLFCEDEHQLICWCCEQTEQHKGHIVVLAKDVSQRYKEQLKKSVAELRKLEEQCDNLKVAANKEINILKFKAENQKRKIQSDFEKLFKFLHEEEKAYLWRLEKEQEQIIKNLQDGEASLEKQSIELRNHILQLEKKSQGSSKSLLQDVEDTLRRSLAVKLETPEFISSDLHTVSCNVSQLYFDMKKMLRSYQVSVTLDPDTAHPDLVISEDLRRVSRKYPQVRPVHTARRFTTFPCILGNEGFTSGRHYFEVDIRKGSGWDLGVCLENVPRDISMRPAPQSGFWAIRLCKRMRFEALTRPTTSLSSADYLEIIGVFLDYEAGLVSFYNMNTGSHIFTFPRASFSDTLRPFFQVCQSSLLLRRPNEEGKD